jgi:thiosulfate/3-mercaptopyruvate sulfurtransferase
MLINNSQDCLIFNNLSLILGGIIMKMKGKKGLAFILVSILVMLLSGCTNASYEGTDNIIEADELKAVLQDAATIVIDARSAQDYEKGHLLGAINLTPDELNISEPVNAMLADQEQIEAVLSAKGISNDSNIYIYDNSGGVYASRVWWSLKIYGHENVKVLNNGQTALENGGFEFSLEVPDLQATDYKASELNTSMIATIDEVEAVVNGEAEGTILDVRSTAEYEEGAIPGALLYAHTNNTYSDGYFKGTKTIYLDYNDLGLEKEDSIILYCKSSFRATQTAVLLEEAGFTNVKIYDGAWLEWSMKDMPQEETEEIVAPSTQDGS